MSEAMRAQDLRGLDWYADDLGARSFVECTFTDVDLSETTSRGAMFDRCVFHNCRFNSSTHTSTAFVACEFRRTNFFDATLDGCKLAGSVFADCTLRPIKVVGGQWQGVTIRGGNLSKLDLSGLDLREADLSLSNLSGRRAARRTPRRRQPCATPTSATPTCVAPRSSGVDLAAARLRPDPARPPRRRTAGGAARRRRRPVVAVSTPVETLRPRNTVEPHGHRRSSDRPARRRALRRDGRSRPPQAAARACCG